METQRLAYTDADWGSPWNRKSILGYCVLLGGNLISWKSKNQDMVEQLSAKARYRSMALKQVNYSGLGMFLPS